MDVPFGSHTWPAAHAAEVAAAGAATDTTAPVPCTGGAFEPCGVWMGGPEEDGVPYWQCGRPKGHPHDGLLFGKVTSGNHSRRPQLQDVEALVTLNLFG
jgi:hypothetical protein